ncbi:DUF4190 domain-containing protein [Streptomyces sp. NPDC050856]|uniref:DUF4190 domain-containing protein n=1 Tax=Streptomyces sp. NPDC050856 TaxID=3154939 RepID=UPI0033CD481D
MEPYPQGPPPAYGPPLPPQAPPAVNGPAIASLVTGVVCCLPPLGLVLGAVALAGIRKRGERGRGLALAGMALSVVSTLLVAAGFATGLFHDAYDGFRDAADRASHSRSTLDLRKGQCFNVPGGAVMTETADVAIVKCSAPHDAEVTGGFKLTGFGKWPGDKPIEPIANDRCDAINSAYALDTWAVPDSA